MNTPSKVLLGIAEADITPGDISSCELVGFNRPDNSAKGILDRLKSQVLVLKSEAQCGCLITVDSIGFTVQLTDHLRDSVAQRIGAKRENVMVCFSHTHSAPDAAANHAMYYHFAQSKIMQAVDLAYRNLWPAKAAWGIAENSIGINRRAGATAMDGRIGILKISDANTDEIKVLLLRVTAHPNVLTSDSFLISSDYFGKTRELLEKQYQCKVMLTQGAAGNIRSRFRQHNAEMLEERPLEAAAIYLDEMEKLRIFNESMAALEKNASEIASAVERVLGDLIPVPIDRMTVLSDVQTFYANVPSMERALEIAAEAKAKANIEGTEWLAEVDRLRQNKIEYQETSKEVQFFVVNQGCLCGIADEPMCELAVDIQKKTADDFIFFGGYTNGYEGYLPSAEEYDKGGYEVLWSNLLYFKHYNRVMPLNRDTATRLADNISKIWKTLAQEPGLS